MTRTALIFLLLVTLACGRRSDPQTATVAPEPPRPAPSTTAALDDAHMVTTTGSPPPPAATSTAATATK